MAPTALNTPTASAGTQPVPIGPFKASTTFKAFTNLPTDSEIDVTPNSNEVTLNSHVTTNTIAADMVTTAGGAFTAAASKTTAATAEMTAPNIVPAALEGQTTPQ